jgi:hypothetical protein
VIIYASVGNSDDRLTQWEWHEYVTAFMDLVHAATEIVHGEWFSAPAAPYQNACICFEVTPRAALALQQSMSALARKYRQESIAWAYADNRFI